MPQTDRVTASRLKDSRVQNYGNAYLGYVEDVVVDPAEGVLTHAIVAIAGPLFAATRRVMVPWSAFGKAYNDQVLVIDADEAALAAYPEAPFDLLHRGLMAGAPKGMGASASFDL